jgi:hypothetical protein
MPRRKMGDAGTTSPRDGKYQTHCAVSRPFSKFLRFPNADHTKGNNVLLLLLCRNGMHMYVQLLIKLSYRAKYDWLLLFIASKSSQKVVAIVFQSFTYYYFDNKESETAKRAPIASTTTFRRTFFTLQYGWITILSNSD